MVKLDVDQMSIQMTLFSKVKGIFSRWMPLDTYKSSFFLGLSNGKLGNLKEKRSNKYA